MLPTFRVLPEQKLMTERATISDFGPKAKTLFQADFLTMLRVTDLSNACKFIASNSRIWF
jgi:hypothetical protein